MIQSIDSIIARQERALAISKIVQSQFPDADNSSGSWVAKSVVEHGSKIAEYSFDQPTRAFKIRLKVILKSRKPELKDTPVEVFAPVTFPVGNSEVLDILNGTKTPQDVYNSIVKQIAKVA